MKQLMDQLTLKSIIFMCVITFSVGIQNAILFFIYYKLAVLCWRTLNNRIFNSIGFVAFCSASTMAIVWLVRLG